MKVVILAGGLGTRISEETLVRPKPMVEIGGKPILWHIMKSYAHHGHTEFVVCCGYKGYMIKEYFANYFLHVSDVTFHLATNQMEVHQQASEPWRVTLVDTGENSQTGGRLKRVERYVSDAPFCFTYGDGVADVDISRLTEMHRRGGRLATVTAVRPPGRFGALAMEGERVTGFAEKPAGDGGWINGGFFVLEPGVFRYLKGDSDIWEHAPLETLARDGQLGAYRHEGFWQPMDTLRDKTTLEELWSGGKAPLEILEMTPGFWSGRRVFLTGHTGFKGSWLGLWLRHLGAHVCGFALAPHTQPSLFAILGLQGEMDSTLGDIRDPGALAAAMARARPDTVIHMAAQAIVRESYARPAETYAVNVLGTAHVLDAVRNTPTVRAALMITSDKCYENREWLWGYREDEAMGGHDPYSSSKGCAELVTAAYRRSFFPPQRHGEHGVALASARAGNVIGGGDWAADRLVPDMVAAFSRGARAAIRNPDAIRPWQHVLEPLAGYLALAERLHTQGAPFAEGWNFGPADEDARPVRWIADALAQRWGGTAGWDAPGSTGPHEATYLKLDCSKARMRLGWQPRWPLAQALGRIVDWHKAHAAGDDMKAYSLRQIREYSDERPAH